MRMLSPFPPPNLLAVWAFLAGLKALPQELTYAAYKHQIGLALVARRKGLEATGQPEAGAVAAALALWWFEELRDARYRASVPLVLQDGYRDRMRKRIQLLCEAAQGADRRWCSFSGALNDELEARGLL